MSEEKQYRQHSPEFRIEIAERMLAGESVVALSRQHKLPRSMMYRWRDAYRRQGPVGLSRRLGRPNAGVVKSGTAKKGEERLRQQVAELERKVGQQAVEIDFFKGVFKRLEELPKAQRRGDDASTRRSDE